jgi:diguanylate cyclase (GGDEF)-like protein
VTRTDPGDVGTDRQLLLPVGLVAVLAAGAAIASLHAIIAGKAIGAADLKLAATLVFLAAVATIATVRIRIRSTIRAVQWSEVAIMIGLAVAPAPWVVLSTGIGVGIAFFARRRAPIKTVFAIAKEMLLAGAGGLVLGFHGWAWHQTHSFIDLVGPLAVAYFVAVVLDELLAFPVLALATGTRLSQLFREDLGLRLVSAVARFLLIVATLQILEADSRLLLAVPPLVLSLHLAYSSRVRARAEQQAWQQLAAATDALNAVDLDSVLRTAVTRATELFSADEAEVELHDPKRTVRGNGNAITFDGATDDSPPTGGSVIPTPLEGYDSTDIGRLRLRFRGPVKLSEREQYTLRTFASALCTAIRNASAYAELARAADEHAHAATHDALTGLANRRHLLDKGAEQLSRRHADGVTALLLVDLNHFKEVNDTLGHASGDQVLIQVAERLRAAVQDGDLVARLGGDEFAVMFRGLPAPAVAAHRAEALLASLHEPLNLDGMRISVEASGGIAVAPSSGGMTELLRRADVAMYQAKRSARRIATYAATRDTSDVGWLALGGDLPRAVADHEFTVHFQPIVDLSTGEVVAAEALARWQHSAHGTLEPRRFIEAIERSGLLSTFTEAVLEQSLIAAESWRDGGFDLPIAVNVSPRSLLDARFPGSILARLRAHELPPDRLILELTETLTISQLEVVDQVLGQLRDEGIRLALDDFGTGYSSLSVLSRIPVHELKIDRAFVMEMDGSPEALAVIRSTVDLGRSLDLVVVAEGVESEPQRRALWQLGCAAGQGHLVARPMPAARLLAALRRGSAGRPGLLAPPLHDEGSVIRLSPGRRTNGRVRAERLPHLHA